MILNKEIFRYKVGRSLLFQSSLKIRPFGCSFPTVQIYDIYLNLPNLFAFILLFIFILNKPGNLHGIEKILIFVL